MKPIALTLPAHRGFALDRVRMTIRQHAGVLAVIAGFLATALVVPVLAPVATTDDWGYTRSVEILVHEGRLTVFPVVAATAVFQLLWGWLFASIFGMTLGAMRLSTLTMTALGGIALYGLLGELDVTARRKTLGLATYLFNPLSFILAYTFMTDAHFTALMTGATWFSARGTRSGKDRWLVAGSVLAACAFLVRQQGALIPVAIIVYVLATRRIRLNWAGVRRFLAVTVAPGVALVSYYAWLLTVNNVPDVQAGFADEARAAGLRGTWRLTSNLSYIALVYAGFFLLPLGVMTIRALPGIYAEMRRLQLAILAGWTAVLGVGLYLHAVDHAWMPYIGQFAGTGGLGPPDVLGSRPRLLFEPQRIALTAISVGAAFIVAVVICHGLGQRRSESGAAAGLVAAVAAFQVIGVLPPSFHYLHRGYSLDRYLLPLLPLGIALFLWSSREIAVNEAIGWLAIAAFAVVSIAGTRDYLTYMTTVWNTATLANQIGIPNEHLDAGAAWDGYHLYTEALDQGIAKARTRNGPWWVYFYGKPTDSSYVVAGRKLDGYVAVTSRSFHPWLWGDKQTIYLLRKPSS